MLSAEPKSKKKTTHQQVSRFFADNQRIIFFTFDGNQLRLRNDKTKKRIVWRVRCTKITRTLPETLVHTHYTATFISLFGAHRLRFVLAHRSTLSNKTRQIWQAVVSTSTD